MAENPDLSKSLQSEVDRILDYLTKLSSHYDLYQHRPDDLRDVSVQTYYTMIARKVQNQAVGKLRNGFETGDPETFMDGLHKFEEAARILDLGIENHEESNAFYQEMINLFLKFIKESVDTSGRFEPRGSFFKLKSLVAVAEVLENVMQDFAKAAGYRNQAAQHEKRWKKVLQYIYIVFDMILSGNFDAAEQFMAIFDSPDVHDEILQLAVDGDDKTRETLLDSIDAFKSLGAVIIAAAQKQSRDSVNIIIDKINELSARGIPITLVSLQKFTQRLAVALGFDDVVAFKGDDQVSLAQLKPPMPPQQAPPRAAPPPVSPDVSAAIKETMGQEMAAVMAHAQAIQDAGGAPASTARVDLSVNGVDAIKQAISESMRGLANEIVSQLSSKIGSLGGGGGGYGGGGRGPMRDLDGPSGGPPQIESLGRAKPTERPPRPKLSDMLDSIIVDE